MPTSLPPIPHHVVGPDGLPAFGTWSGRFLQVDFSQLRGAYRKSALQRLKRHKRWVYHFVATQELAVMYAIADLGYSSNAFMTAVHLPTGKVLADESHLGLPRPMVHVSDETGVNFSAHLTLPTMRYACRQDSGSAYFTSELRGSSGARGTVRLLTAEAAPFLAVVAPVEDSGVNVTHKHAALNAFGTFTAQGRTFTLDGGVGGLDFTHGLLARETAWRWGFGCGRLSDGTPVGFNLVEGFNEAREDVNENAIWVGTRCFPIGRARFEWNRADTLERWHVHTVDGALDLKFSPIAVHREFRDLGFASSRFQQPIGRWKGTLRVEGKTHEIQGVPGVTEDQQVKW